MDHNTNGHNPATEVQRPKRRQFSPSYKLRILKEADQCHSSAERGALLRREGLYSSNLKTWRRQLERGELDGAKPGRKPKTDAEKEVIQLRRENERLKRKLEQAETIISVQKKLSQLLGLDQSDGNR